MDWQDLFRNADLLKSYLIGLGPWAPWVFIGLQATQVIIAPIPGEITGAIGGYVFGGFWGTIYATIGLAIGSACAFVIAKWLGRPMIIKLFGAERVQKLDVILSANGIFAIFIVFLLPGFPKDVASYCVGVSKMSFRAFFVITQLARIPGTILLCYTGGAVAQQNWQLLVGLGVATAVVVTVSYVYREQISKAF